ncbi:sensor histidine kinase [Cognatishimia activa]|uniref:sensor histidine kinase n=1 Tax=Cognatishimia activa TaxID=1715691 RepID=UPI00222FBB8A|nr:sensor histidine kinase [Cognatishimia activa]UZD91113.1 sensor histidine kinase [Cognatishimia activa]
MALAEGINAGNMAHGRDGDVVLGDDWVAPESTVEKEMRGRRERRRLTPLRRSPLTRKIITFNLIALLLMAAGILYLNSSRENFVEQHQDALVSEAELLGAAMEVQMPAGAPVNLITGDGVDVQGTLDRIPLRAGVGVVVIDLAGNRIAEAAGPEAAAVEGRSTPLTNAMNWLWNAVIGSDNATVIGDTSGLLDDFAQVVLAEDSARDVLQAANGEAFFAAGSVLDQSGRDVGVIILTQSSAEVDQLVLVQRERVLQMFLVAIVVSIGLSVVLASTISNPLSDLAAAAEIGRDRDDRQVNPGRVRIPDLTARPDEIGRLSTALRGMVGALYERIDSNEQFAADVAHEIKNPLASLRSAVGSLRMVKREDHREKLLNVIEHDVRRLDRLVSDISNASRLDAELVKEEEEQFNLVSMIGNLTQYLGEDAKSKGIDFISDLPSKPIEIMGLEARLAQVFVNLITNAISFCEDGDAIRVWVRKRQNRVLVVVEDTGPGIPDQALNKIFNRFYSERPHEDFGNNSGLGLAISKQIVEAHGGVIWAENIRPTEADITSEPLGARFVVGVPV